MDLARLTAGENPNPAIAVSPNRSRRESEDSEKTTCEGRDPIRVDRVAKISARIAARLSRLSLILHQPVRWSSVTYACMSREERGRFGQERDDQMRHRVRLSAPGSLLPKGRRVCWQFSYTSGHAEGGKPRPVDS